MINKVKSFHPRHLSDLRKSGLNDVTIDEAGIYTVPPGEIGKKLGGLGNNVVSALAFPYPGFDGYERYKVWREEGKTGPKYIQKTGTPNHLYLPPSLDLKGDSPLIIVEGEKKCLALRQNDAQVVGLAGVFSWLGKDGDGNSHPLPDFDLVNWHRPVFILFDSDGSDNHNVRLAAWRLAREVARRGGRVLVLFLPAAVNGEKVGVDDYLVEHGPESLVNLLKTAWPFDPALNDYEAEISWQTKDLIPETPLPEKLKRLSSLTPILARLSNMEVAAALEDLRELLKLRAADLADLKGDIKAARNAQKNKGKIETSKVKDLEESFRLHPAIDFLGGAMSVGFRVNLPENDTGLLLLFSDGQGVRAEVNPDSVDIGERVYHLIQNTAPPFLQDVWDLGRLKAFLEHPSRPGSLFRDLKEALAQYLDLPEPAYGLLAAWSLGTYFAHLFTAFPFLQFHGPKESGNLIGLLSDSYKKAGGKCRVVEITKAGRSVLEFSTFGPKAFASTKDLDPDLRDRCIKIPMTRTRRKLPDLEGWEPVWGELRDKLYRFTLAAFKDVRTYYEANPGNGTRIGELWRPILAVLLALGVEQAEVEAIRALFMEAAEEGRHELTSWEIALFEALRTKTERATEPFEMSAQEIIEAMELGEEGPGLKWVGETLTRFHLFIRRKQPRAQGKRTRVYEFSPTRVKELCEIYFRDTPLNDPCHLCQGGKVSNGAGERGTGEKCGTCANLCHLEEMEQVEQVGTCGMKLTCATESPVNSQYPGPAQVEQVKSASLDKKFPHIFVGEVDL